MTKRLRNGSHAMWAAHGKYYRLYLPAKYLKMQYAVFFSWLATTLEGDAHSRAINVKWDNVPKDKGIQVAFPDGFPLLVRPLQYTAGFVCFMQCALCDCRSSQKPP